MPAIMLREHKKSGGSVVLFLDRATGCSEQCIVYSLQTEQESIVNLAAIMRQTTPVGLWPVGIGILEHLQAKGYVDLQVYARSCADFAVKRSEQ